MGENKDKLFGNPPFYYQYFEPKDILHWVQKTHTMTKREAKQKLPVGTKIKIGKQYAQKYGCGLLSAGRVITLIEGHFEYDNGLYCEDQICPSIWDEESKEYDSIFHLFGNELEHFMDCKIITCKK